ncbi:hypothetical protein MKZ38_008738 [Zalerion maritima]|uniref:NAD(P)-binding protein n=1 Tax=Zalerion maritima TaxID=339359 RepID=A0AAD5RGH0_9PEZI|nr:hypothetical protein MKZ38_008738 [Zalerion maritima]
MSLLSLKGIALVTGAGSGIGRALSILLAQNGVQGIALADKNSVAIAETEKMIKGLNTNVEVLGLVVDVAQPASVDKMVADTVSRFGGINYAANIAGLPPPKDYPISQMPIETYDKICSVNSRGVFLCMQSQLRAMEKQHQQRQPPFPYLGEDAERAAIVNVASLAGIAGVARMSPYVSSKHAVVGLTKTAALEYGSLGIRVNAVCPGYIETPMIGDFLSQRGVTEADKGMKALQSHAGTANPMGRIGKPEEVAEACAWLLSPRASYVNGVAIPVDGGLMSATSFSKPVTG